MPDREAAKSSSLPVSLTGGDLLASALKAAGVEVAFALHGGHLEALLKASVEQGIRLLDCRHEAAAGHAADAYARTTGRLGVAIVTAGPGFTNALSAVANARLDGSPVLVIIGAPPLREQETNPLQGGIDQIAAARALAKWAVSVASTERIADMAALAIRKAMNAPCGPVILEVPIDVLHMAVSERRAFPPAGVNVRPHPAPSPDEAAQLATLLRAAKRPVLIAGFEAANTRTAEALRAFTARVAIPVFTKPQAAGLLPPGHPSAAGSPGMIAALPMLGAEPPDLVILLGAKMGLMLGGRSGAIIGAHARVAQIHSDAAELGRMRDIDLGIVADTSEALRALDRALGASPPDFIGWRTAATRPLQAMAAMWPDAETERGIHPWHAALAVAQAAGPDACYALDGGEASSWGADAATVTAPARLLGHGYLGCLGIGPGFAIGLQLAHPDKRVIHLTGDGAFGFHLQELDTMVRHRLPIVNVLLNNEVWGMSIHGQQMMFGANYNVITRLGGTRFADIATAFGCHGERVTQHSEIAPAMRRALAAGRPALIEIMTDAEIVHPVTVSMLGQVAEGSADVMIPYYENIET